MAKRHAQVDGTFWAAQVMVELGLENHRGSGTGRIQAESLVSHDRQIATNPGIFNSEFNSFSFEDPATIVATCTRGAHVDLVAL